jgi:hypothetical protein
MIDKLREALDRIDYHGARCTGCSGEADDRLKGTHDRGEAAEELISALLLIKKLDLPNPARGWRGTRSRELLVLLASGRPCFRQLADFTKEIRGSLDYQEKTLEVTP